MPSPSGTCATCTYYCCLKLLFLIIDMMSLFSLLKVLFPSKIILDLHGSAYYLTFSCQVTHSCSVLQYGRTALHWASESGNEGVVLKLLWKYLLYQLCGQDPWQYQSGQRVVGSVFDEFLHSVPPGFVSCINRRCLVGAQRLRFVSCFLHLSSQDTWTDFMRRRITG